jgi:hypothetical protein
MENTVSTASLDVPTTKILAIGTVTEKGAADARLPIMPLEVRATVRLHLAGKIDQWFFQTEGRGVVFIMNVTSTARLAGGIAAGPGGDDEFPVDSLGAVEAAGSAARRVMAGADVSSRSGVGRVGMCALRNGLSGPMSGSLTEGYDS